MHKIIHDALIIIYEPQYALFIFHKNNASYTKFLGLFNELHLDQHHKHKKLSSVCFKKWMSKQLEDFVNFLWHS